MNMYKDDILKSDHNVFKHDYPNLLPCTDTQINLY